MHKNLRELRLRRRAMQKVLQVTEALERISWARLQRVRALLQAQGPYAEGLRALFACVREAADPPGRPLQGAAAAEGRIALVVFGADRGLCGGFNRALAEELRRRAAQWRPRETALLVMGRAVRDRARRLGLMVEREFPPPPLAGIEAALRDIARAVAAGYRGGAYAEAHVAYAEFVSGLRQVAVTRRLLPLAESGAGERGAPAWRAGLRVPAFEPATDAILDRLAPELLRAVLREALLNSLTSEHAARHASMRRAADGARTMIDELTALYNRRRQETITTEMIEIATGAGEPWPKGA
jgi:F-type H+-transporting ATPase subunit gamma